MVNWKKTRNNILLPTAEQQYLLLKEHGLLPNYDNYDHYASYLYDNCKDGWNGRSVVKGSGDTATVKRKNNKSLKTSTTRTNVSDYSLSPEERLEVERVDFEAKLEKLVKNTPIKIKTNPFNIVVEKFKSRRRKNNKNYRNLENTCPYCMSKLKVNKDGLLYCVGDKFKVWDQAFLEYDKAKDKNKLKVIEKHTNNINLFLDLYDKWSYANKEGEAWNCGYNNTLFNPVSSFDMTIPDPIVVAKLEKGLGRKLSEEERRGESKIYYKQGAYFIEWEPKSKEVKIPILRFPYSFLTKE